jgi:hypothetical protein
MTTVRTYRSTDASAPTLTGSAGALVALLDACLVNGYGSQSAAGWTIAYTATSQRAYRNSATDGTGYYLNIDDTGGGAGGAREAFCTGFVTMSALGTGTGQFPLSGQLALGSAPSGAVVARKSSTADSTARAWTMVADDTVFYLIMETGDQTYPMPGSMLAFGDFFSVASGDTCHCMIVGRNQVNTGASNQEWFGQVNGMGSGSNQQAQILTFTLGGHYLAGMYNGVRNVIGSTSFGKHTDTIKMGAPGFGATSSSGTTPCANNGYNQLLIGNNYSVPLFFPYPNGPDGGLYMDRLWIHANGMLRGYFKGIWCPLQSLPMNHNDTFNGTGAISTKSFLAQNLMGYGYSAATIPAQIFLETSSTWS